MQTRNDKLRARAIRIMMAETGLDEEAATGGLEKANGSLPVALLMARTGCSLRAAERALAASGGVVGRAAEIHRVINPKDGK